MRVLAKITALWRGGGCNAVKLIEFSEGRNASCFIVGERAKQEASILLDSFLKMEAASESDTSVDLTKQNYVLEHSTFH
jgi:hypothetical protein